MLGKAITGAVKTDRVLRLQQTGSAGAKLRFPVTPVCLCRRRSLAKRFGHAGGPHGRFGKHRSIAPVAYPQRRKSGKTLNWHGASPARQANSFSAALPRAWRDHGCRMQPAPRIASNTGVVSSLFQPLPCSRDSELDQCVQEWITVAPILTGQLYRNTWRFRPAAAHHRLQSVASQPTRFQCVIVSPMRRAVRVTNAPAIASELSWVPLRWIPAGRERRRWCLSSLRAKNPPRSREHRAAAGRCCAVWLSADVPVCGSRSTRARVARAPRGP